MLESEFPRAILHLDGDAFFVACEVASRPDLKGKPVVTGAERGIASAMSYEAKALGITRATPIYLIRKNFPQVIVLSSNYRSYRLYAQRMYEIVRRYSYDVEEYSIDECFADITGLDRERGQSFESILREIQDTLRLELGINFSIGLSVTKVLAKIASKHNKPNGIALIPKSKIKEFLKGLPIGKVWGIGGQTSAYLLKRGIKTAEDFVEKSEDWVNENCSKPYYEIWLELRGLAVYKINSNADRIQKSLASTGTFYPPSSNKFFIFSELSKHIEQASHRARILGLVPSGVSFFLKTKDFNYYKESIVLPQATTLPHKITSLIEKSFNDLFRAGTIYRATGVTLYGLIKSSHVSRDLFGESNRLEAAEKVFQAVDSLADRFGNNIVFIGSSLQKKSRNEKSEMKGVRSKIGQKSFNIPFLGRVK